MNCCEHCFTSQYLKEIINGDDRVGDCHFCSNKGVSVYGARELLPLFRDIFSLYDIDEESDLSLVEAIEQDFSLLKPEVADPEALIRAILHEEIDKYEHLFAGKVSSKASTHLAHKANNVNITWSEFKDEIKYKNRFHIEKTLDKAVLGEILNSERFERVIKKGRILYRCRISGKDGYECEKMGNPPNKSATGGRANPDGISYLYVGDTIKTCIYELRASLFDYITAGEFHVIDDLRILNLRNLDLDPIPWSENGQIEVYLTYVPFLNTLQKELSIPVRKEDKLLEYIPTQYISEFIKSNGFDGVEYQSSVYSSGYNIVIFNPEKLQCRNLTVHQIKKIELTFDPV